MRTRTVGGLAAALAGMVMTLGGAAAAAQPAIEVRSAGAGGLFAHEKDAMLRDGLRHVGPAVERLMRRFGGDPEVPPDVAGALAGALFRPMHLQVDFDPTADPGAETLPVRVALAVETDGLAGARALFNTLDALPGSDDPWTPLRGGIEMRERPGSPTIYRGAMERGDGAVFFFGVNAPTPPRPADGPAGERAGLHIDMARLTPVVEHGHDPEDGPFPMLRELGLLGPDALVIDASATMERGRSRHVVRVGNARALAGYIGLTPEHAMAKGVLGTVPADATLVRSISVDPKALLHLARMGAAMGGAGDPVEAVREMLGVDVEREIIAHLGTDAMLYQSLSTGGGGLASSVISLSASDGPALMRGIDRLAAPLAGAAAQRTQGSVGFSSWAGPGGIECRSVVFPSLPAPLTPSWGVASGRLLIAPTRAGLVAAIEQALTDGPSVLSVAAVTRALDGATGAVMFSYTDTAWMAERGYSVVALAGAALNNLARRNAQDDVVITPPSYGEFAAGIEPSVSVTRWEGDELVRVGAGDGSMLVGLAAASQSPVLQLYSANPLLAAGVLLPATGKARGAAMTARSAGNLRGVAMAVTVYSAEQQDRLPASLDVLLDDGYLVEEMLASPLGPASDGGPDYAMRTDLPRTLSQVRDPVRTILAIDRASLFEGDAVIAAFLDGHVETIEPWRFAELMRAEQNRGGAASLGVPDWMMEQR